MREIRRCASGHERGVGLFTRHHHATLVTHRQKHVKSACNSEAIENYNEIGRGNRAFTTLASEVPQSFEAQRNGDAARRQVPGGRSKSGFCSTTLPSARSSSATAPTAARQ